MRSAALAAAFAVILSGWSVGSLAKSGGRTAHYPATPVRPHVALGSVRVLAVPVRPAEERAVPIAEAARVRYGAVDALANVRLEPLPSGQALVSGTALRWR